MLKRWLPWNYLVKFAARRYGIMDPLTLMARLRRFSQPSEVQEPIELLRAGILFHARGLVNTRAIQHNLDWVWPFWVEKQFDPKDPSFIPRAFSFSHVNLTHRNWTAVGCPGSASYPIVDPRGLVTPFYDGWSLDAWLLTADGRQLFPSRQAEVEQQWRLDDHLTTATRCRWEDLEVYGEVRQECHEGELQLVWQLRGQGPPGSLLIVSLRPYNPEGIQFVETVAFNTERNSLIVDDETSISFSSSPERVLFANYEQGDVSQRLAEEIKESGIRCEVGMATAALGFPIDNAGALDLDVRIDLVETPVEAKEKKSNRPMTTSWSQALEETAVLEVPDEHIQFLYDAAVRSLILLAADDVVPGPYTYKRFWFRDACLMLNALLCVGLEERALRCLNNFPGRQKRSGYFLSQEGEWDSNGQVLWIVERFLQLTGRDLPEAWQKSIWKGADWILRKRLPGGSGEPHAGLLPPGFSAEHFGPNDYYYWDDFWGIAGLGAAGRMAANLGRQELADRYLAAAEEFSATVWKSIDQIPAARSQGAIPASPYRRLDAGAIGCLVADYPLQLVPEKEERVAKTAAFMQENCFLNGAFFQDMIHSGINPYLTLAVGQTLLRNGDPDFGAIVRRVADLASPTGQWPEAVHPFSGGGCMGDGQHGWAAAEWVMMVRNMFIREENNKLVLGSGVFPEWLESRETLRFGPAPTPWGPVTLRLVKSEGDLLVELDADWRGEPPELEARLPGYQRAALAPNGQPHRLIAEEQ